MLVIGRNATFSTPYTPPAQNTTPAGDPDKPTEPTVAHSEAKERAQEYSKMSKAELNAAYDKLRSDPAKASIEGMKMHKAYFKKP